jgi:predicted nucleic acid-binding protein
LKVLLDTNIILDALQERKPFDIEAKEILLRSQNNEYECCITANAITDIFYLYSKARDIRSARSVTSFLLKNYTVVSITHKNCIDAMSLPIKDFEDALVIVCAIQAGANYIITRDKKLLQSESSVPIITTDDFLRKI